MDAVAAARPPRRAAISKGFPAPVFGALHEVAIERIRFDVAGDCDEMPVVLHDEGLEASLIDLSRLPWRAACSRWVCVSVTSRMY